MSSVLFQPPKSDFDDPAEHYIDMDDIHEFKTINFCFHETKNITLTIQPTITENCKYAKLVLAAKSVEILREIITTEVISTTTLASSSEKKVEAASFQWWHGLLIGIVVL